MITQIIGFFIYKRYLENVFFIENKKLHHRLFDSFQNSILHTKFFCYINYVLDMQYKRSLLATDMQKLGPSDDINKLVFQMEN